MSIYVTGDNMTIFKQILYKLFDGNTDPVIGVCSTETVNNNF